MAYTTPATSTAGTVLQAAYLNTYVRDNISWMATDSPCCRAYNSAQLNVSNTVVTALTYNSERFDNAAVHSTSVNTSRMTIPTGASGKYLIGFCGEFVSNGTGERAFFIHINGTTDIAQMRGNADNTPAPWAATILSVYVMNAADYVELNAYQNSGGTIAVDVQGNRSPEFYVFWFRT